MSAAVAQLAFADSIISAVALPVVLFGWLLVYFIRFRKARAESPSGARWPRLAAFAAALALMSVALLPPIDSWAERLFTMHMVQHILLADLVPLLLLLGLTAVILRPLTKRFIVVEKALGPLANPFVGLTVWLSILYLWHIPALYDAALRYPILHVLEHASFIVAGIAFWWPLIQPVPMRRRLDGMKALGYLLVARLGLGLLGIYLAWTPSVVYNFYKQEAPMWGLTHQSDQTIGAMVMMGEQSIVVAIAFVIFFYKMLERSERDQLRRESGAVHQHGADRH